MKVIFDSNVLISATLKKNSSPDLAFRKAKSEGDILCSVDTLKELTEKLFKSKFDKYVSIETRLEFLMEFKDVCEIIKVLRKVNICRDPKDNKYLELAMSGRADCIVSGDKDLLVLHPFKNIPIISASDFLKRY